MVKCVSLFTGAGGLDVGAENAGAEIIKCIEIDHDSVETLKKNSTPKRFTKEILEVDISEVSFKDYADENQLVIIGGPPCQPFSKNGYWVKNENRLIEKDHRNLLSEYLRALKESNASAFLFENVESIMHPTNKSEFERFISSSEKMAYKCTVYKANALDFGVPQIRKRIFVFGVKNSKKPIPAPKPTHCIASEVEAKELKPHQSVGSFITEFDKDEFYEPSEIASHGNYYHELLHVPAGKNYMALSKLDNYTGRVFKNGGRFWNFLYKLHPDLPSITIAAQPGPWVGPFHWNNRRLRVPEIAAIQTFPKEYKFYGTRRSVQKQIGNAVPPLLAEKMFRHLMDHI